MNVCVCRKVGSSYEAAAAAEHCCCHSLHSASRHRCESDLRQIGDVGMIRLDKRTLSHLSRLKSDILIREISVHVAGVGRKSLAATHPRASESHDQIILHDTDDALIHAARNRQP
jgi:hypothetical protein